MRLKRQPGTCHWCGNNRGAHPWKDCPANGRTCSKCGGNDHFACGCLKMSSCPSCPQTFDNRSRPDHSRKHVSKPKQQPVNVVECDNVDDEEDFGMYTLDCDPLSQPGKRFFVLLKLVHDDRTAMVRFQIDSGTSCSTISLGQLRSAFPNIGLDKSNLRPYGNGSASRPCGQVTLTCEHDSRFHMIQLQVLPDTIMQGKPALLSASDSVAMDILRIEADMVFELGVDSSKASQFDQARFQFASCPRFLNKGYGCTG